MPSSIYGVHDEAKDKDFELEMSWVCDESNRQHEKVRLGCAFGDNDQCASFVISCNFIIYFFCFLAESIK